MPALLALEHVDKHYGAVHAVRDVSLAFEAGAIHMVAGENGAGKSTLLKMAAGVVAPDAGHVRIDGRPLAPHTVHEAIRRGVGMVQQHFALVGALPAIDNVVLGAEPMAGFGRIDRARGRARAEQVARDIGVTLPWDARVESLGVGDRQRLEIVRTLFRDARIVILDEPTAVLTPGEAAALYATLRRLAEAGRAVVVVTHHLDEVRDHADWVSVMRRGTLVSSREVSGARGDTDVVRALTRDIMGEEPAPPLRRTKRAAPGEEVGETGAAPLLVVEDVHLGRALRGVSFTVAAGEILGIAGVEGNGQRELVRVLAGLDAPDRGVVRAASKTRGAAAVVYEDRHSEGLALPASVRDNLVLGELARFASPPFGVVDGAALESEARARMERGKVVPPDLDAPASALSGGNQQKIVVARAVARADRADVLVFAQPTRGVDLGAARAIHGEILGVASRGKAVVVVSADLGELRALSDRILVIARGRIAGEYAPDASDARLGEAMLGAGDGSSGALPSAGAQPRESA